MNPDPMPFGVRWAVRILGACGHMMLVPASISAPFFLVSCLAMAIGSGLSVLQDDLIMCVPCFALLLGQSMCAVSESIKAVHCRGKIDFNPNAKWMEVLNLGFYEASAVLLVGALTGAIQLASNPMSQIETSQVRWIVGLHLILALLAAFVPRWLASRSTKGKS